MATRHLDIAHKNSINAVLDEFFMQKEKIYNFKNIIIFTQSGTQFSGEIVEYGSLFIILKSDTEQSTIDGDKIYRYQNILKESVVGFEYRLK